MHKKNFIQAALFVNVEEFEENKLEVLTLYRTVLAREAEKLDPKRKDDPEFWKTIKPEKNSVLGIIESQIKENPTLFYEYMDGRLDLDFEKIADVKSKKNVEKYLRPLEKGFERAEKIRENYPEIKADILSRMANIENHPNKENEITAIKDSIREIPRELIKIDFLNDETFKKYSKEVDPNLEKGLFDKYEYRIKKIASTKEILLESQKERLRSLGKKTDGMAKDDESQYAGEMFLEDVRSGKIDEKITRHQELDAKINVARMQVLKNRKSPYKGTFKLSPKNSPEVVAEIKKLRTMSKSHVKGIAGVVSLAKYMAKPKMIVDEIEIPVGGATNPEKTSDTFETLLKEQGLIGKFKAMEGELTIEDYASKMGDIIYSINEKIKDGSLPKEINVNGSIKQTTIQDIVKMNFENTDILFENLPEDISKMNKEEISKLIENHVKEKGVEEVKKRFEGMRVASRSLKKDDEAKTKPEQSNDKEEKVEEQILETEQEPEIENTEESKKEKPKDEKEQEEEELENDVVPVNSDKKEEGPTQDELQERLAREQRDKELAEENKAKEEVKDIVEEAKAEEPKIEEKKAVESEKAIAKDTFFNRVKRGFLNNPVVKKINELFGKKEEKDVFDTISANDSKNSKPITKEEDDFVQKVDGAKSLKDAHKEMEEKKVRVAVQDSREEEMEIGDE